MPAAAEQRSANLQPRIADAITAFAGSMKFVYYTQWSSLSGCSPSRKALWPTLTSVASRIWFESWPSRTQVFGFGMSRGSRKWRTDALPEAAGHLVDPGAEDQRGVARLREAVYGTIVVLSVLAVLSESERSANIAALIIAGTSLVLFFAQVYAGSVAERIRLGREPGLGDLRRLAADSWPVAAVTLWPLVLLGLEGWPDRPQPGDRPTVVDGAGPRRRAGHRRVGSRIPLIASTEERHGLARWASRALVLRRGTG
jgi:hypothetical protein